MFRRFSLASIICLLLVVFISSPVLAGKSYHARQFDVHVDIQAGGTMLVTETVTFQFEGGPFTYVFRHISRNRTDNIQILDARMDGAAFQPGKGAGQVEIVDGDPIKVTWHFNPQSNSTHQFILHYQVKGVICSGINDSLIWSAIPEERSYTIEAASISLTYPFTVQPIEAVSLNHASTLSHLNSGVCLNIENISEDEGVILTAKFALGSLVNVHPTWQVKSDAQAAMAQQALPYGLGVAFIVGVAGLVLLIDTIRKFRRKNYVRPDPTQQVTHLPRELAPALAGRLAGSETPFLGTLFDLARRGVLGFQEGKKQRGGKTFDVVLFHDDAALAGHEKIFVDTFFKKGNRVALADIGNLAFSSNFIATIDEDLTAIGLRDPRRKSQRSKVIVRTLLALVFGSGVFFLGVLLAGLTLPNLGVLIFMGAGMIGAGIANMLLGLAGLLAAALISTLSNEGEYQAERWKSFCGYLRGSTRGQMSNLQPEFFDSYLPYAAGFGIVSEWGKYFKKMGNVPVPAWLQGLGSSLEDGSFSALLAVLSGADSSAAVATCVGAGTASGGGASGSG